MKVEGAGGGGVKQILGDGSVQAAGNHYDVRLGPAGVVVFTIGAR